MPKKKVGGRGPIGIFARQASHFTFERLQSQARQASGASKKAVRARRDASESSATDRDGSDQGPCQVSRLGKRSRKPPGSYWEEPASGGGLTAAKSGSADNAIQRFLPDPALLSAQDASEDELTHLSMRHLLLPAKTCFQ